MSGSPELFANAFFITYHVHIELGSNFLESQLNLKTESKHDSS